MWFHDKGEYCALQLVNEIATKTGIDSDNIAICGKHVFFTYLSPKLFHYEITSWFINDIVSDICRICDNVDELIALERFR